ncbi:thiolase family protein [Myxococcota bacterium]|nr:thiolase family protein [Myxococcota bacterium]MBU1432812.1 thiolase family protein [Myxococcota bacterium]MBU1897444.1 thiolase family protein [Myxococcota bacterium]
MQEAVIVGAARTPVGRIKGALSSIRPDDLAALALRGALARAGVEAEAVEEVFLGCANQAGEDNRNVARMATLLAGLPQTVPAMTLNRLCASGLSAVNQAARLIQLGEAEVMLAGGVESMSRAPWVMPKADSAFPIGNVTVFDTSLGWRFPNPAMERLFPLEGMGITAENIVERQGISRARQDAFALESHQRAVAAIEAGAFKAEIIPVEIPRRGQAPLVVDTDEGPRADTSLARLAGLKPAFKAGGTVTAGNSSTLNDGAAALVLMSRARAEAEGREILATFKGAAAVGLDPRVMGLGPIPATQKLLKRLGLSVEQIALAEVNEAFAAQSLAVLDGLGLDPARVNVNGGAIALGHPLGASGARILTTLIHALRARGGGLGLATLCVGVGQGVATLIEV